MDVETHENHTPDEHDITPEADDTQRTPYPNVFDDPDPPKANETEEKTEDAYIISRNYGGEMLEEYRDTKLHGETLWEDLLTAFRTHTIKAWDVRCCQSGRISLPIETCT